jgi:hypothetical protein
MITTDTLRTELRQIAETQRREADYTTWPDCWTISEQIRDAVIANIPVLTSKHVTIEEYLINGTYGHYTVTVSITLPDGTFSCVIDASFDQFATDTDTPINIAPNEELDNILTVSPAEQYVFHNEKTL